MADTPDRIKYVPMYEDMRHGLTRTATLETSRDDILTWLYEADEDDTVWILSGLAKLRPNVMARLEADQAKSLDVLSMRAFTKCPSNLPNSMRGRTVSPVWDVHDVATEVLARPILQFSSPMFFCEESEGEIVIDVLRIGNSEGKSVVTYRTEDESAHAGESYAETSGQLEFLPGETTAHLTVKLLASEQWNTTTEFKCILNDEGLSGAILGQYLYETRIKIIDSSTFPSNKFKGVDIIAGKNVPKLRLLVEYCRTTWSIPEVRIGTIRYLAVDLMHNLAYLSQLLLSVYLLDYIVDKSKPVSSFLLVHSRPGSLFLLAGFELVLVLVLHICEYLKYGLPVGGKAKAFLQNAILRKFLNYTQPVRAKLETGDVVMAMDRDVPCVVVEGYCNALKVFGHVGQVVCLFTFELAESFVFEHPLSVEVVTFIVMLPVILCIFLYWRTNVVAVVLQEDNHTQNVIVNHLALATTNCNLVFDYSVRNFASERFSQLIKVHTQAHKATLQLAVNNIYFARWMTVVAIALYTCLGGMDVVKGSVTVGMFVTNLKVLHSVGDACGSCYKILVDMQTILPSMVNIARLLNLPTDLHHRKVLKRDQRKRATAMRDELLKLKLEGPAVDALPISLNLAKFSFLSANEDEPELNLNGHVELKQGHLVALVGRLGSGKATLLKLISGAVLPRLGMQGGLFVPAHLRVVNVAETSMFYGGTLQENLAFGMPTSRVDSLKDRIRGICELLQIEQRVLQYLDGDEELRWENLFSAAQCKLLNVARALLNNAELICFHKPLATLDTLQSKVVMKVIHQHVTEKGILQLSNSVLRRPRTVIITSSMAFAVKGADDVIKVSREKGCERIAKEHVTEDLLA